MTWLRHAADACQLSEKIKGIWFCSSFILKYDMQTILLLIYELQRKAKKLMKTYEFEAATIEEAKEYISEIEADLLNEGDKAIVTFPDGSKQIFILTKDYWKDKRDNFNIIKPDINT